MWASSPARGRGDSKKGFSWEKLSSVSETDEGLPCGWWISVLTVVQGLPSSASHSFGTISGLFCLLRRHFPRYRGNQPPGEGFGETDFSMRFA